MPNPTESQPLLPIDTTPTSGRLGARRYTPSPTSPSYSFEMSDGPENEPNGGAEDVGDDEEANVGVKLDKGKGRASLVDEGDDEQAPDGSTQLKEEDQTRSITVIFSNHPVPNLSISLSASTTIASLKALIQQHYPDLEGHGLRLIHAGRLLTDGVRLIAWVEALEKRVKRGAEGRLEGVVREVREMGEGEGDGDGSRGGKEMIWIHCIAGGKDAKGQSQTQTVTDTPATRLRGFDTLLDAGFTVEDVAQMRRQFYESRGEEVPEGVEGGDNDDEHSRALEEQWIEGDLTAETATTSTEGLYITILHGLLLGFLYPLMSWFFFRELPLPNFFDADDEARVMYELRSGRLGNGGVDGNAGSSQAGVDESHHEGDGVDVVVNGETINRSNSTMTPESSDRSQTEARLANAQERQARIVHDLSRQVSTRVAANFAVGGLTVPTLVFGKRMQMGILLGTVINVIFGLLRMLN